jgi:membrane-associated phospholipid phosphatase
MEALYQFQIAIILLLQSLGSGLAEFFRLVSMLGSEEFFMLVMPSLYWCFDAALGLRIAAMLLLSNGINDVFKVVFHAPRPYWMDARVKGFAAESSFGIPSGHAQNATGIWGLLAASRRQAWEKAALIGVIFLIGFSRIYVGVHFISDVLAGWLIGGLMVVIFLKVERPVIAWLKTLTLVQMIGLALVSSFLLVMLMILPVTALGAWTTPAAWVQNALASQPDSPIDPLNLDNIFTVSGTWLGMAIGVAWLYHRQGGFDTFGTPAQRLLRYAIGAAGILLLWFGLGKVFPRNADVISFALRFFRYTLVGLWISAIAPLVFERFGLSRVPEKKIASFSPGRNPL